MKIERVETMVADRLLSVDNIEFESKQVVNVPFEWFELGKKRILKTADDGTEIGISIEETKKAGDVVAVTDFKIYVISVLPCQLIKTDVSTMEEMGRLTFELGNRHLPIKIVGNQVLVPFDEPTFNYLEKLGFNVEEITDLFDDSIVCKAHGHSHDG